jgi:hypothetical protein
MGRTRYTVHHGMLIDISPIIYLNHNLGPQENDEETVQTELEQSNDATTGT